MKKILIFSILILSLSFWLLPLTLQAQTDITDDVSAGEATSENRIINRLQSIGSSSGYNTDSQTASVPRIVGLIINALLSLTGVIFIILTVYAGFNWMTSEGNEEKVKKSISTIKASVIGLIVTLSAWTIWNFIFDRLIS